MLKQEASHHRMIHMNIMIIALCVIIISLIACQEDVVLPPQCIPGKVESCPCIGGLQGVQVCAQDGRRFLPCDCGQSARSTTDLPLPNVSALSPRDQVDVNKISQQKASITPLKVNVVTTSKENILSNSPPLKKSSNSHTGTVTPIETPSSKPVKKIVSKNNVSKNNISKTQNTQTERRAMSRTWWMVNMMNDKCMESSKIENGLYYPSKMLANGCYQKSSELGSRLIRCDDPPLGPENYRYFESKLVCQAFKRKKTDVNKATSTQKTQIKLEKISIKEVPQQSNVPKAWHCMCYQEVYKSKTVDATACRPSRLSCKDLEKKVREGSDILIKDSMFIHCDSFTMTSPWERFGPRYLWLPSSQPGAWWSPRGCLLPNAERAKRKWLIHHPNRSKKHSSQRSKKTAKSSTTQDRATHHRTAAASPKSCSSACWANLATSKDLQQKYGVKKVPYDLKWGKKHANRVSLVVKTCIARKLGQGKDPGKDKQCFNEGVKACTRFCERSSDAN